MDCDKICFRQKQQIKKKWIKDKTWNYLPSKIRTTSRLLQNAFKMTFLLNSR